MSQPTLFLDTTIQIGRIIGSAPRRRQIQQHLANQRLITSTYVLGEFLRTLVKDAIKLHHLCGQYSYLDEVLTELGQLPNKRETSRMTLLLGTLLRGQRVNAASFTPQMQVELQDRLTRYIEFGLLDHFMAGIDELLDSTECGLARERPQLNPALGGKPLTYRLRSQCVRHVRECNLAERLTTWQPELRALASGLAGEKDPALLRMGQLAQQISLDPVVARGRNCTWYLGDMVIALELPADVPLYTTNRRHFAPILAILGKKLYAAEE